ncbi:MAG: TraR/DksA C4-type zinc finger protein [Bacteroidales bacterium]
MTEEEKKEIREIIAREIEKTTTKIEELQSFIEPVSPDNAIGRVSRMDAIQNKTIYEASVRNSKERLRLLEHIQQNQYDSNFGACAKCGKDIQIERLRLRPEIRFCARCFTKKQAGK